MKQNLAIIGAGISGLVAALLLAKTRQDRRIFIIEKSPEIGGLLKSFNYGEFGYFDYGMHTMAETGIEELDQLLFSTLNEKDWDLLEGPHRDLAGLYWKGNLQTVSPYMDIRSLADSQYRECLSDFFYNLNQGVEQDGQNAYDYAMKRFGKAIADHAINKAIKKIYKRESNQMDIMATKISPLSRVVLFNEPITADLVASKSLRDRIAFIDQRDLPLERSSNKNSYYPSRYGMYQIIDGLKRELIAHGVTLMTNAVVTGMNLRNNRIDNLTIFSGNQSIEMADIDEVYWSTGLPALGRLLNVKYTTGTADRPLQTVLLNILLDKKLNASDLYYFYCYEEGFNTFRLTNYSNYCTGSYRNGGYPICLEMLVDPSEIGDPKRLMAKGLEELTAFGVVEKSTNILFNKLEFLESGFPMPTLNNVKMMDHMRDEIKNKHIENLETIGVMAEKNLFFQGDILADAYLKIRSK